MLQRTLVFVLGALFAFALGFAFAAIMSVELARIVVLSILALLPAGLAGGLLYRRHLSA
jgi:hypothetical protein